MEANTQIVYYYNLFLPPGFSQIGINQQNDCLCIARVFMLTWYVHVAHRTDCVTWFKMDVVMGMKSEEFW